MLENSNVQDSKLFLLLKILTGKEIRELELWLSSPIHNKSESVLHFYRNIIRHHPNFDEPINKLTLLNYSGVLHASSERETISPKEEAALRKITFKLTAQIQDFLAWQKFKEDKFIEKRYLMDTLLERKMYKLVSAISTRAWKELHASPQRHLKYGEHAFLITEMDFYLNFFLKNRGSDIGMQEVINILTQAYLSKLLKYYCAAKNGEKILKNSYEYPFIDSVKKYVANNVEKNIPVTNMYYMLLNLIDEEKDKYYYELKNYLFSNVNTLDNNEIRQFFSFMINHCVLRDREGKTQFWQEQHEIYLKGLAMKCWSTGLHFSIHQFVHTITNALKLNKLEWANQFVEAYQAELNPNTKDNIVNYCKALISFHTKELGAAQSYLSKINAPKDFFYHLRIKLLLIKIYYDLKDISFHDLDSHPINYELESIRQHTLSTRNKKMSEFHRESQNNFVRIFRGILERRKKLILGNKVSKESVEKLRRKLAPPLPVKEREWLTEKIDEMLYEITRKKG